MNSVANRVFRPASALAGLLLIPLLGPVCVRHPTRPPWRALRPDLNRDPASRIRLVPGIGPVRARAIVEERQSRGPYADPSDVARRVRGIGPALTQRLAEFSSSGR
ncbi:MAG: ComEA family DNA-binding protein [Planctomycetota bacterium]